jgi:secondary thiamine-phosphate synthase enzyme
MEKIHIKTTQRIELVDITKEIQGMAAKNKIKDGVCCVFCPHTTAGLTINENADPAVKKDIIHAFNTLVPARAGYLHSEGNADSHVKSSIFGASLTVIVENGKLMLGTWQGICFCESDGPRAREIWVKIVNSV